MNQVECKTDFGEIETLADFISPVYQETNSEDSPPTTPNSIEIGSPVEHFYDQTWLTGKYEPVTYEPYRKHDKAKFSSEIYPVENTTPTPEIPYYYPTTAEGSENVPQPTQYFFPPNFDNTSPYYHSTPTTPSSTDSFGSISPENFTGGVQDYLESPPIEIPVTVDPRFNLSSVGKATSALKTRRRASRSKCPCVKCCHAKLGVETCGLLLQ